MYLTQCRLGFSRHSLVSGFSNYKCHLNQFNLTLTPLTHHILCPINTSVFFPLCNHKHYFLDFPHLAAFLMARFNKIITILFIIVVVFICYVPCFGARKVLSIENMNGPVLKDNIIASANTKSFGSPPTKIGHAMEMNEILHISKHSIFPDESVPSPGAGN